MEAKNILSNKLTEVVKKMYDNKVNNKYQFKKFQIKKADGSYRDIIAPCASYIADSRDLLKILELLLPKKIIYSNRRSICSVYKYIQRHNIPKRLKGKDCAAVKIDIKSAFQSTTKSMLTGQLAIVLDIDYSTLEKLVEVVTLDGILQQGLPTSRLLFEICAKEIDKIIVSNLRLEKIKHTLVRYIDDILVVVYSFSKDITIIRNVFARMKKLIYKSTNYRINKKKTKIIYNKRKEIWFLSACIYHPNDLLKNTCRRIRISRYVRNRHRSYLFLGIKKGNKKSLAIAGSFKGLI